MDEVTVYLDEVAVEPIHPDSGRTMAALAEALHPAILLAVQGNPEVARFLPEGATMSIRTPEAGR